MKIMPTLFLGHGSPMNALANNSFTQTLAKLGERVPRPKAILVISAHWMTEGSWLTAMERPKTIHDFYGFPQALFEIDYPAPGAPEIARFIQESISDFKLELDTEMWGLDHGTWSVLRHMYPDADIPALQLSLHMEQPASYHFKLGQALAKLRSEGILILGSGNIVHNLRQLNWDEKAQPHEWAVEFDQWSKEKILNRDFDALQNDVLTTQTGRLSVPTFEHYYPLLYILGASNPSDGISFECEEIQNASIAMRCVLFGM